MDAKSLLVPPPLFVRPIGTTNQETGRRSQARGYLSVRNITGVDLRDVSVHLSSEPPFVTPGVWRIDRIAAADVHHLTTVDLKLDQAFLSSLTASRRAELVVRVESSRQPLAERKIEVNLLPPGTGQNDANSRQQ